MRLKIVSLAFVIASFANAGSVFINLDRDDCKNGWLSMDIKIQIDSESFNFSPACNSSFSRTFKTKAGVSCRLNSGMCSSFSPRGLFEISCNNSSRDSETFECQKPKPKPERIR